MEKLWRIMLEPETDEVQVKEFQVVKETEHQFHVVAADDVKVSRVAKVAVDRLPGVLGGGKWYSGKEKALQSWHHFHHHESLYHQKIAERVRKEMGMKS